MRPLALRAEEPAPDAVVVVRGGSMQSEFVRRTASDAYDEVGIIVLPDLSEETLSRLDACFDPAIPNPGRA